MTLQSSSCANRRCSDSGVDNLSYSFRKLHEDFSSPENPLRITRETIGYVEEVGGSVEKLELDEWFVISFALDDPHHQDGPSIDRCTTDIRDCNCRQFNPLFYTNVVYSDKPGLSTAVSAAHTWRLQIYLLDHVQLI